MSMRDQDKFIRSRAVRLAMQPGPLEPGVRQCSERENRRCRSGAVWGTSGSQLLEFALALPFLVVLSIGLVDFGSAYNLKQKLANAAREGARIGASSPTADLNCGSCATTPNSVTAIRDAVANYLTNANVTACTVGTTPTYSATNLTWTYTSSTKECSAFTLTIQRGYTYTSGTSLIVATNVALNYPYTWSFNRIIGLLVPGANPALPTALTTGAVIENLVN